MDKTNNVVKVSLTDPETNMTYTCMISAEDAARAEADMEFAQRLLQHIISEREVQDTSGTENEQPDTPDAFRWAPHHVLLLIRLVETYENMFDLSLKKKVWIKIAAELTEIIGKTITPDQVDNKWKGLKKTYKKIKDHNNSSGRDRKNWEFFNAMDSLLCKKPEISPVAVCSSSSGLTILNENLNNKAEDEYSSECSEPSTSKCISNVMRKRKRSENLVQKRHNEKMARYDKFLDLFKLSVEHQIGKKIDD